MSKVHYMDERRKALCNQPPPPPSLRARPWLRTTRDVDDVTCKRCLRKIASGQYMPRPPV